MEARLFSKIIAEGVYQKNVFLRKMKKFYPKKYPKFNQDVDFDGGKMLISYCECKN